MDWDKLKIFHAVAEAGSFTEANFGSYARVQIYGDGSTSPYWTVANSSGTVTAKNTGAISFPESTSGTNTITHVVLLDHATKQKFIVSNQ